MLRKTSTALISHIIWYPLKDNRAVFIHVNDRGGNLPVSVYDDVLNHLLAFHQAADVRLRVADEAGGTAGRRLLLH